MKVLTLEKFQEEFFTTGDFQHHGRYVVQADVNFSPTNGNDTIAPSTVDLGEGLFFNFDIESINFQRGFDFSSATFLGNVNFSTCEFNGGITAMRPTFIGDFILLSCKCNSFHFGDFTCLKTFNIDLDAPLHSGGSTVG